MSVSVPFSNLKVGMLLPNSAVVMAYAIVGKVGVVLCSRGFDAMGYATWVVHNDDLRSTSMGHYFPDCAKALSDFQSRVNDISIGDIIGDHK